MNRKPGHMKGQFNENWQTPDNLFSICQDIFHIKVDGAASAENTKCRFFFDKIDDALGGRPWKQMLTDKYQTKLEKGDSIFINPPYGAAITDWVFRAVKEVYTFSRIPVVMLLPASTGNGWMSELAFNSSRIYFLKGRLTFYRSDKPKQAPAFFDSMVAYINPQGPRVADWKLRDLCTCVYDNTLRF